MQIQQKKQYLSREDLVNRWCVSRSTIERLHSKNSFPYIKIGRRYFYSIDGVRNYEKKHIFLANLRETCEETKITEVALSEISKIPIERIIALSTEELTELAREANNNLTEARSQKEWVDGIIAIRNLMNDQDSNNDNNNSFRNNNILGGVNEQITNY